MVIAFTEISNLVVTQFYNLMWAFSYFDLWHCALWLRCFCLVSGIASKADMPSQIHSPYCSRIPCGKVISKQIFSLNSVLQILRFVVLILLPCSTV